MSLAGVKISNCFFLGWMLLWSFVRSETFVQKLHEAEQNGRITETDALYFEGIRIIDPEQLPAEFREDDPLPVKCSFGLVSRIRQHWSDFSPEQKETLKSLYYRPQLPKSFISPRGRFKVHYAVEGRNSVPAEDLDGSGVPDYVEKAAQSLDTVYSVEVETLGYKPPPADNQDGPEWDIYILNVGDEYGGVTPDEQVSYDPDIWTSYMELDNQYDHTSTKGLDALYVTAAHEFFHMIQLGYNYRVNKSGGYYEDRFIMEASSTWMEDVVYDRVNDYYYYLPRFFNQTNVRFDQYDYKHEYGLCLWFHFLVESFQDVNIVRSVWEEIVDYPAFEAMDHALRMKGSRFSDAMGLFYGWNCMTGSRADTLNFYSEGNFYPEIRLDGDFRFQLDTTLTEKVLQTAARYYRFTKEDGFDYLFSPANVNWEGSTYSEPFTLVVVQDAGYPQYIRLDGGIQVKMTSEAYLHWKCAVVVESPDAQTGFIPFEAVRTGFPYDTLSYENENLPASFPNPFVLESQSSVQIPFISPEAGVVQVWIGNASGYCVRNDEKYYPDGGVQFYCWDGKNEEGKRVSGGIYFYMIASEGKVLRKNKFAVVR